MNTIIHHDSVSFPFGTVNFYKSEKYVRITLLRDVLTEEFIEILNSLFDKNAENSYSYVMFDFSKGQVKEDGGYYYLLNFIAPKLKSLGTMKITFVMTNDAYGKLDSVMLGINKKGIQCKQFIERYLAEEWLLDLFLVDIDRVSFNKSA